jgi:hypothetical protein
MLYINVCARVCARVCMCFACVRVYVCVCVCVRVWMGVGGCVWVCMVDDMGGVRSPWLITPSALITTSNSMFRATIRAIEPYFLG